MRVWFRVGDVWFSVYGWSLGFGVSGGKGSRDSGFGFRVQDCGIRLEGRILRSRVLGTEPGEK